MNGKLKPIAERLILDKDEKDEIFVDSILHQHHIDGIRFLYKQFKKQQTGVIINNPLGYGNSLQVALFLGAIQHLLEKPILILCEQSKELNWLEHFQKRTQTYSVAVAADNPFMSKSIFINTMEQLDAFSRRPWSVMVIDNDIFINEKKLQNKFEADYKIWITPVDMKENLDTLSMIYQWLCPKEKIDINDFKPKGSVLSLTKTIELDYFLQDIVFRTTLLTPFENPYRKSTETPHKVSRKNKDITGTKIKRSKRSLDESNNTNNLNQSGDSEAGASAVVKPRNNEEAVNDPSSFNSSDIRYNKVESDDDIDDRNDDIESFIRNKEPLRFDAYKDYIQEFDNISNNSQDRPEFMDYESDSNMDDNIRVHFGTGNIMDDPENYCINSDTNSDCNIKQDKCDYIRSQESDDSIYEAETQINQDIKFDNEIKYIDDHDKVMTESKNYRKECDQIKIKCETITKINQCIDKEYEKNGLDRHEINDEFLDTEKCDGKTLDTRDTNKETTRVNKKIKNDLDSKITEHMDRATKKFKGSLLDSIF